MYKCKSLQHRTSPPVSHSFSCSPFKEPFKESRWRIATPVKKRIFPPLLPVSIALLVLALACCHTVSLLTDSTGGKCSQRSFLCSSNYCILLYLMSPLLSPSLSVNIAFSQRLSHHTTAFRIKTLKDGAGSSWLKATDDSVRKEKKMA